MALQTKFVFIDTPWLAGVHLVFESRILKGKMNSNT